MAIILYTKFLPFLFDISFFQGTDSLLPILRFSYIDEFVFIHNVFQEAETKTVLIPARLGHVGQRPQQGLVGAVTKVAGAGVA